MSTYTQQNGTGPASLGRSSSFLSAIKGIVTAPLGWFATTETDFEDTKGKRRRLPAASEHTRAEDDSLQSKTKRMRVSSPDRDPNPYLDPPGSAFKQPRRTSDQSSSGYQRHLSMSPRKTLRIPAASATLNQSPRNRHTLSPHPSGSHLRPQGVTRTMSLDPPSNSNFSSRVQRDSTMQDVQEESRYARDAMSISRDASMSPRHLRIRSSLTPQPSGASFGPIVPPRRERDPNEPPPLTALMSNPTFVKPPPGLQKPGTAEPTRQLTLGSLIEQRNTRAPVRQSSILFGTGSMTDVSARHLWPVNAAEIALHDLEVYKTPLLPTRLKGSTAIPDMFVHKKSRPITLMNDDRPVKPRLGTKGKGKDKGKKKDREAAIGSKPYSGEGGMKKLLSRRKREEEQAKEKEKAEAMEDERAEEEQRKKDVMEEERKRKEELRLPPPPPASAPAFEPRPSRDGPLSSSLRVGRARTGRNHIDRPVSRRHNKFSAAFEDDDDDMDDARAAEQKVLEEAAKKVPVFEIPAGFTFAKEAPITHDLTNAKEPPITSLPFSFAKPTNPPPASATSEPPKPISAFAAPALPSISLVPPTPDAAKTPAAPEPAPTLAALPITVPPPAALPATTPSGIPNFFANSSVFDKPTAVPAPPTLSFTAPAQESPKLAPAPVAEIPKMSEASAPLFSAPPRPMSAPSLFGASPPSAPFSTSLFGSPSTSAASASNPIVGAPPATSGHSFFGAQPRPAVPKESEKPAAAAPTLAAPFSFGAPPKLAEPSLTPSAPAEVPKAAEAPKPATPFGGSPFSFGAPPAAAVPAKTEAPKSAFGQPAAATAPTSGTLEAPKPLFGTQPSSSSTPFSFGQRPSTAPAEERPASNPFSFGSTPSTPSAAEKKPAASAFSFGAPAAPAAAPAFSFGGTSSVTSTDASNKSFSFGQSTPARPVTPPKVDQEVNMDESPTREINMNGNGKAPERPSLNFAFANPSTSGSALFAQSPATTSAPFSFGGPSSANPFAREEIAENKPAFGGFGQQSTSSGFSFGQKAPETPAAASSAAPFGHLNPNRPPASPFTFGPSAANPFGQSSASPASAPSSPATINPTPAFSFGTPTTSQPPSNPFAFGASSQPASPANNNTTLPSGSSGGAFTFGASSSSATPAANPFGGAGTAPAAAAGSLFTIGSAPPPPDSGRRMIKGLPRRGGRR
ncbi:hypothetical protein HYDPIDRAFT_32019 [Hydnomerulius pinastri MD-312]|uniref:Nuclear pore complex NUP2/50/61 domain-containing protein n=1 Tax=Hydnomerulius pinastri MD-312 TaxID=994086 RepID=A0A0C9V4X5_9AGAM|nr:hypothetical protein HYDPIDRAFT_32019 [Hydnomerulius pinastri MD-312]